MKEDYIRGIGVTPRFKIVDLLFSCNYLFLDIINLLVLKNKEMDNVQKLNNCIITKLSQTFRFYFPPFV
jgi:hypothetical protein